MPNHQPLIDALVAHERKKWDKIQAKLHASGVPLADDWPKPTPTTGASRGSVLMAKDASGALQWDPLTPVGYMDIIGHSHMADVGATSPDFGMAHKIDGFLQPATWRSTALGGAIHSRANQGNGFGGDGGWSQQLPEFDRQELVTGYAATTLNALPSPNPGATTISVAERTGFYANEWITVGQGANTEIVKTSSTYVAATGAGNVTLSTALANTHASGDPVYHSIRNAGYLAKSELVLIGVGYNDLPPLGPVAQGTFGTTPGASRGLVPLQNALRFTLAQMRCSVIYYDTHPSIVYSANWVSSNQAANPPAAYPHIEAFGANGGNLHYVTAANAVGATITFSTDPDFQGGAVNVFFTSSTDGGGSNFSYAVSGATTVATTALCDARNAQHVLYNSSLANSTAGPPNSFVTGVVGRIKNLNAGVNTITISITATAGAFTRFLGWGPEPPQPPLIYCFLDPRLISYAVSSSSPYYTRTPTTTQTATVAAGAGTAAGSVTLGTAVTVGTTATGNTAVYPGDTITIGTGATRETRRITAVASTTTLSVDANFVNAHTGEACVIGLQDADIVGGGYVNTADTQGAVSVPGVSGAIQSVVNEFDQWVKTYNTDAVLNPPGKNSATLSVNNFASDGIHYSDVGHGLLAADFLTTLLLVPWTIPQIAAPTVPNKRTWIPVYGDGYPAGQPATGATPVFANGWTNYYSLNTLFPRTAFYKDMQKREVKIRGAVTQLGVLLEANLPSAMFTLPPGYRPAYQTPIFGYSSLGPALIEVDLNGNVWVVAGFYSLTAAATGILEFYGHFLAEA